jgi:multisubunit Na+/H+ antiporter MnhG subunit
VGSSSAATPLISLVIAQILVLGSLIVLLGVTGLGRAPDGVNRS